MLFVPEKVLGWFSLPLRVVTEDKPRNYNTLLHTVQRNCVAVGNA